MSFNIYEVVHAACQSRLGTFRSNDETETGTSLHVLSVLSAIIPTYCTYFVKCTRTLLNLNSKWPYSISESKIKFRHCLFTFSIKHEIRYFHVVVAQTRQRKVQKKRDAPRTKLLFCLLRRCYTRRFATTVLSATQRCNIVATLFRIVTTLFQRCNAVLC